MTGAFSAPDTKPARTRFEQVLEPHTRALSMPQDGVWPSG